MNFRTKCHCNPSHFGQNLHSSRESEFEVLSPWSREVFWKCVALRRLHGHVLFRSCWRSSAGREKPEQKWRKRRAGARRQSEAAATTTATTKTAAKPLGRGTVSHAMAGTRAHARTHCILSSVRSQNISDRRPSREVELLMSTCVFMFFLYMHPHTQILYTRMYEDTFQRLLACI